MSQDGLDTLRQPTEAQPAPRASPQPSAKESSRMLALIPARPQDSQQALRKRRLAQTCFALAAAAAFSAVFVVAFGLVGEHFQQAPLLAERTEEAASLAQTVGALKVRLDAIEGAKFHDDLADLRRSIGEMKANVVSAREFNGALTQLSQRVDREESAQTAELAARIDKLEKKVVAPVAAAPPVPTPQPAAQIKQPPIPPRFGDNVSMEATGSIARPRPLLHGYIVLDARDDVALVGGRYGAREVRLGDFLPGAGRVERIERRGRSWIVLTNEGLIAAAEPPRY